MKNPIAILAFTAFAASSVFAQAEVLDGKAAKKLLFSHKGSEFVIQPQDFMSDADMATLNTLAGMREFKSVLYYGAVAVSPKDGVVSKATVATGKYHSIEAANSAAIKECNGLRSGGAKCVVVAQILPKKYSVQPFSLSASATAAFKKTYLRGKGDKAMAISLKDGSYGVAIGDTAAASALTACASNGAKDCKVVVQD